MPLRAIAACVGLAALCPAQPSATDDSFAALMRSMSARPRGHATFVERQFLGILTRPLESSGELYFEAPDLLEKHTLEPKREDLAIRGDSITVSRSGRSYTLPVRKYPQVAALIEGIRAILAGDAETLRRSYSVTFASHDGQWTVTLVPRESALAGVKEIRFGGASDLIRTIEIDRTDGDHSTMAVTPMRDP